MASGTGIYGDYAKSRFLVGLTNQFLRAECYNTSTSTIMSDLLTITWVGPGATDDYIEMNVLGGVKVFTISQAGTVNAIRLKKADGTVVATIDVTPVVYSTPTYYTLSTLTVSFN